MAKFVEQYVAEPVKDSSEAVKVERNEAFDFDEYLYEALWDADLDLQLAEDDQAELNYHFGYITALREVASKFFDYGEDQLDRLSPTYVGYTTDE